MTTSPPVINWKVYLEDLERQRDEIKEKVIRIVPVVEKIKITQNGKPTTLNSKIKEVNKDISERICLRCDEYFMSASISNRSCIKCLRMAKSEA